MVKANKIWGDLDDLDPELITIACLFAEAHLIGKIDIRELKSKISKKQYNNSIKIIKENNPEWLI